MGVPYYGNLKNVLIISWGKTIRRLLYVTIFPNSSVNIYKIIISLVCIFKGAGPFLLSLLGFYYIKQYISGRLQ